MGIGGIIKNKVSGLLGGLRSKGTAVASFPTNEILKDYGILDNPDLFKVNISAYQQEPMKIQNKTKGGFSVEAPAFKPIMEFSVLHSASSLNVSHSHSFGDLNTSNGIISKTISSIGKWAPRIVNTMAKVDSYQSGESVGLMGIGQRTNVAGSFDIAEVYKDSQSPPFTVEFTLMTHSDPLKDVVIPAQILTWLTYPKLGGTSVNEKINAMMMKPSKIGSVMGGIVAKAKSNIPGSGALDALSSKPSVGSKELDELTGESEKEVGKLSSLLGDTYNNLLAGSVRYRVGVAPPVFVIRTSNGTHFINNAHCTSISVNYMGPWLGSPSQSSISSAVTDLIKTGSGLGSIASSIFPSAGNIGGIGLEDILGGSESKFKQGGYPSYATVTMEFKSNFSKKFGEEWLLSLGGGGADSKVSVKGFVNKASSFIK